MITSKTRKQVDQLTEADIEECPVWEFALDEGHRRNQDEATVRPYRRLGDLDPSQGMFIVRASFQLADGTAMRGYLTPEVQGDSGIETTQPVIISPRGQVLFWCGMIKPSPSDVAAFYERLDKRSPSKIFPIRFQSEVPFLGGPRSGEIPGFMVLEDLNSGAVRILT